MIVEPLDSHHDRLAFTCGNERLDRYLHEVALQAKRKGLAAPFVAIEREAHTKILGDYTLSACAISGLAIPEALRKRRNLPAHHVGATMLGRLAVATRAQRQGIGGILVVDALIRSYAVSREIGSECVVVDALDARGADFYRRLGFVPAGEAELRLVLMMDTIAKLR